jgi:hypothetical protein
VTDEPTDVTGGRGPADPRHPSRDAVADYAEGLLPDAAATAMAEHLATCPSCRDTESAVHAVRRLLAGLQGPGPMPADVAARLDAGLSAAAATAQTRLIPASGATAELPATAGTAHGDGAPSAGASTVVPLGSRRRPRMHRLLQAAAAVVLLGGGAALLGPTLLSSGGGSDSGQPTSGGADSAAEAGSAATDAPAAAGDVQIVWLSSSGLDYRSEAIPEAARDLLARVAPYDRPAIADSGRRTAEATAAAAAPLGEENVAAAVSMCARTVGATPLAIDEAAYGGQPAWLVVRPGTEGRVEAWVVPPGCPVGETLYFVSVPAG